MAEFTVNWKNSLGRIAFTLSILVLFTSLIDLFVNRLLFRAGPEVLAHVSFPGVSGFAVFGRISFTFEQIVLFVILGSAAIVLIREREDLSRRLGLLLVPQLAAAALLYAPLPMELAWGLSMILVIVTGIAVFGLIALRVSKNHGLTRMQLAGEGTFLLSLALSFFFPLYYRMSLLLGAINIIMLPFSIGTYTAGIYSIMATAIAAFAYALTVKSPSFRINARNFVKAVVLPTVLVAPVLYGLIQSFLMVQIFSLVIAMSTDIVLSIDMVRAIVFFSWFLLVAVVVLFLKGRSSGDRFLIQQGIGLVLILSTTFLFNYPNYLLLGTGGILLISYPLTSRRETILA